MKLPYRIIALSLILIAYLLHADRLGIHNKTPRDLYVAIYRIGMKIPFKDQPKAKRITNTVFLESDSYGVIERPEREIGSDRELVFVEDANLLKQELTKEDLDKHHSKNVGNLQGDVFYIGDQDGEFYGYTTSEWNVVKPIIEAARAQVLNQLPQVVQNPYKNRVAHVRTDHGISAQEKIFLERRMPRSKNACEQLTGKSLDGKRVPLVALVESGGGYRATLFATGVGAGAEKSGIMDVISHLVGLSGSTWAIAGYVSSGKSFSEYHDWLIRNVKYGLRKITIDDAKLMGQALLTKYMFREDLDIVDLYGLLLANELFAEFGDRKQRMTLSGQLERAQSGTIPWPIYTAIFAQAENIWITFDPAEVGSHAIGGFVPSWSFGRPYRKGKSVNFAPEQSLGVLLGTFGLAIGISLTRLVQEIDLKNKVNVTFVHNIIDRILEEAGENRLTTSNFFNFTYQMDGTRFQEKEKWSLVDAGILFNLPAPPILGDQPGRIADIIIFVDASSGNFTDELRNVEKYAQLKKYKFPPIDYTNLDSKGVSLFIDKKDPQAPVVIYIPRVVDEDLISKMKSQAMQQAQPAFKDVIPLIENFNVEVCLRNGPCSTFNFKYSEEEARALAALGMFNMMAAKDAVVQALNWKIEHQ